MKKKNAELKDKVDRILEGLDHRKVQCPTCKEYVWKGTLSNVDSRSIYSLPMKMCKLCIEEYRSFRRLYGYRYTKNTPSETMFKLWKESRIVDWIQKNKPKKKKRRR